MHTRIGNHVANVNAEMKELEKEMKATGDEALVNFKHMKKLKESLMS